MKLKRFRNYLVNLKNSRKEGKIKSQAKYAWPNSNNKKPPNWVV
jgi:hypothetical protein